MSFGVHLADRHLAWASSSLAANTWGSYRPRTFFRTSSGEIVTVYGLWQRQLFVFVFVILGGILWDLNPASGGQWRAAREIGTVAALVLGAVQVLRSRLILTPDRVRYVGLVRSWSMPADQLVAIELRSTRSRWEMARAAVVDSPYSGISAVVGIAVR